VGVLDGVPDYRDACQTAREKAANTAIALCCSRARSAHLVLDL
jgi:vanillate O-demethylase ferredoxin subunit